MTTDHTSLWFVLTSIHIIALVVYLISRLCCGHKFYRNDRIYQRNARVNVTAHSDPNQFPPGQVISQSFGPASAYPVYSPGPYRVIVTQLPNTPTPGLQYPVPPGPKPQGLEYPLPHSSQPPPNYTTVVNSTMATQTNSQSQKNELPSYHEVVPQPSLLSTNNDRIYQQGSQNQSIEKQAAYNPGFEKY